MGWLSGWGWRKKLTIGNSGTEQTDYSLPIKVYDSDGTDGTETLENITYSKVYTSGLIYYSGFKDIRFTESDGTTLCNYYNDFRSDSNYARLWVNIPTLAASDNTDIYMYMDGSGASHVYNSGFVNFWDIREHDMHASYSVYWQFTKPAASSIQARQGVVYLGNAYWSHVVEASWIEGKRVHVRQKADAPIWTNWWLFARIVDEPVQRRDFVLMPNNSSQTWTVCQNVCSDAGQRGWTEISGTVNTSDLNAQNGRLCTLMIYHRDSWTGQEGEGEVDWIKIKDGDTVVREWKFYETLTMERTDTQYDRGVFRTYSANVKDNGWGSFEEAGWAHTINTIASPGEVNTIESVNIGKINTISA